MKSPKRNTHKKKKELNKKKIISPQMTLRLDKTNVTSNRTSDRQVRHKKSLSIEDIVTDGYDYCNSQSN